ncbi:hypothetical protein LTR05_006748 [Lithohypha guttulata]|uniref:S-adenosyl-L-methionine-dependent methyltransferase n=1 Tax=Lithohypha guttulata TaxID=1690604 RepID=A0AAN7Y4Q2_9EURO|nr:hypothetical protein LTR05_006748 [Lithohypha guttulata]
MKEAILQNDLGIDEQDWNINQSTIWQPSSLTGKKLENYVKRRARGEPLQYILGTQPFGELEIKCRPNVLIPRWDTEVYTAQVARLVKRDLAVLKTESFRIADICTGSGCIALLLHSLLESSDAAVTNGGPYVWGFDVSQHALALAKDNLRHNIRLGKLHQQAATESVTVIRSNLSKRLVEISNPSDVLFDVIVSNPPYISPNDFRIGGTTTKSVRKFEPRLALVPPSIFLDEVVDQADQFYVALLRIAVAAKTRLLVMEIGDTEQALRVRELCRNVNDHLVEMSDRPAKTVVEIWSDDGGVIRDDEAAPAAGSVTSRISSQSEEKAEYRAVAVWFSVN